MFSERQTYLENKEARARECLRQVLASPPGVAVLAWVLGKTGYTGSISYQDQNPGATSFLEGRRSIGHDLSQDIASVTPDGLESILTFMAKETATDARINNGQPSEPGGNFPVYEYGHSLEQPAGQQPNSGQQ